MIITILPASTTFHAVRYNENKVEQGRAELIEMDNFVTIPKDNYTTEELQKFLMDYTYSKNHNIKKPQFHVAVSCKGSEYTYKELMDIARRYLHEMGYDMPGQPVLFYAHHDTNNRHIHIVTSRIAPDGHKIDHNHERRRSRMVTQRIMEQYTGSRQEPEVNDIIQDALAYKYATKAQFCAILECLGYDTKDDEESRYPTLNIYKNGQKQGSVPVIAIMDNAKNPSQNNDPSDDKRKKQLRVILQKYRNLSADKEELAATMKKKFGVSLVFLGKADSPYGYIAVDHKNKTVYKGGELVSIKRLLQFEDAETRFARIDKTIDDLIADNPKITISDVNRILYRQFGTRIKNGKIVWKDKEHELSAEQMKRFKNNNIANLINRFHPSNEEEKAVLCALFKYDNTQSIRLSEPDTDTSDTVKEFQNVFGQCKNLQELSQKMTESNLLLRKYNNNYYCIDFKRHKIACVTDTLQKMAQSKSNKISGPSILQAVGSLLRKRTDGSQARNNEDDAKKGNYDDIDDMRSYGIKY